MSDDDMVKCKNDDFQYRTCAIISRGLFIFYPFFTAVYIVERFII